MKSEENLFIQFPSDTFYDLTVSPVPSFYVMWPNDSSSMEIEEASDKDIMRYAAQSPAFRFLNHPDEDVYTAEDGEEICH